MPAMTPTAGGAQRRRRPGSPAASGAGAKPIASASATRSDAGSPRREEGRTSSPVSSTDRALAEIDALAFATDPASERALREGLAGCRDGQVWPGGLRTAAAALGQGQSPRILFVDLDETPYPGRSHSRAGRGVRGRDRGDRARLRRQRPVQPGDPARRGERLPGQAAHRGGGARGGGAGGRLRRQRLRGGLAGRVRGNRRKRCDDARRGHRPARGRARAVRLGARSEPDVLRSLLPARRRARRRPRRSPQHRRAGVVAPGHGGRDARGAFGPDRGLRVPVERGIRRRWRRCGRCASCSWSCSAGRTS